MIEISSYTMTKQNVSVKILLRKANLVIDCMNFVFCSFRAMVVIIRVLCSATRDLLTTVVFRTAIHNQAHIRGIQIFFARRCHHPVIWQPSTANNSRGFFKCNFLCWISYRARRKCDQYQAHRHLDDAGRLNQNRPMLRGNFNRDGRFDDSKRSAHSKREENSGYCDESGQFVWSQSESRAVWVGRIRFQWFKHKLQHFDWYTWVVKKEFINRISIWMNSNVNNFLI